MSGTKPIVIVAVLLIVMGLAFVFLKPAGLGSASFSAPSHSSGSSSVIGWIIGFAVLGGAGVFAWKKKDSIKDSFGGEVGLSLVATPPAIKPGSISDIQSTLTKGGKPRWSRGLSLKQRKVKFEIIRAVPGASLSAHGRTVSSVHESLFSKIEHGGMASARLSAGHDSGEFEVSAAYDHSGSIISSNPVSVVVKISSGAPAPVIERKVMLSALPQELLADGLAASVITAELYDKQDPGKKVVGEKVDVYLLSFRKLKDKPQKAGPAYSVLSAGSASVSTLGSRHKISGTTGADGKVSFTLVAGTEKGELVVSCSHKYGRKSTNSKVSVFLGIPADYSIELLSIAPSVLHCKEGASTVTALVIGKNVAGRVIDFSIEGANPGGCYLVGSDGQNGTKVSAKSGKDGKAAILFRAGSHSGEFTVKAACRKDPSKFAEDKVTVALPVK